MFFKSDKFKEAFYEITIWIVLFVIGVVCFVVTTMTLITEMNYVINGTKVIAEYDETFGARFVTKDGKEVYIETEKFMRTKYDDTFPMYYFEGKEYEAIMLSAWQWWVVVYTLFIALIAISVVKMYQNLRGEKMVRVKFNYEHKDVSSKELSKILIDNMSLHNKELYEKHLDSIKFDTIKYQASYDSFKESAMSVINEQEKIWKIGSVHIGVLLGDDKPNNEIRRIAYTDGMKHYQDPHAFYELVKTQDEAKILEDKSIHIANTLVCNEQLPFAGNGNRFYLVVAKYSLCENVLLMPEWYYFKEEIEAM